MQENIPSAPTLSPAAPENLEAEMEHSRKQNHCQAMRVEHSRLGLPALHPHGLAQRAGPGLETFWGSETAGTLLEADWLQASFQKIMVTWLPYLDCVQRVADDDTGCTWGSRRLAGYSAPGL